MEHTKSLKLLKTKLKRCCQSLNPVAIARPTVTGLADVSLIDALTAKWDALQTKQNKLKVEEPEYRQTSARYLLYAKGRA